MNSSEASELINQLLGHFEGTYFDGPTAETFSNSFATNDYEASKEAVRQWIETVDRFPTVAELNGMIRRIRGDDVPDNVRHLPLNNEPANLKVAAAAFERGYRQARVQAGDTEAQIVKKLGRLLGQFFGSIARAEG